MADTPMTASNVVMPTEGPWTRREAPYGWDIFNDEQAKWVAYATKTVEDGSAPIYPTKAESGRNADLIVAACNSYQRHFSNPIAAAESDWIARAVEALRLVVGMADGDEPEIDENGDDVCPFEQARTLLSQVREVRG